MQKYLPAVYALLITGIVAVLSATLWMLLSAPVPNTHIPADAHFVHHFTGGML